MASHDFLREMECDRLLAYISPVVLIDLALTDDRVEVDPGGHRRQSHRGHRIERQFEAIERNVIAIPAQSRILNRVLASLVERANGVRRRGRFDRGLHLPRGNELERDPVHIGILRLE